MIETILTSYDKFAFKVGMSKLRFYITVFISCVIGAVITSLYITASEPPIVHNNNAQLFKYVNGVTMYGVYIDRTRSSWCPIDTSRIITTKGVLNGRPFSMSYSLYTQNFTWPYLGRQVFGILFTNLPSTLPDGKWALSASYNTTGCHWYSDLWRPKIEIENAINFDVIDGEITAPNMLTVEPDKQ
jgi:hypothetical protein